ncbi:hypothetical protein I8J29_01010 [Paenibacillus sp. MWE-103]|uniref:DUF455 family protein n=1 Tax=Paenibacillus artemisiicola TaxID=1172618 RepID=A0ABS3W375_9BACL|nr:hypothetical protein [Paenibacillus artemisiicola]MBO7742755.1 hypothetical protein [Paenibacillus artemisiicola]
MLKFSGIANPYALGKYGVEQNARVLQRYRFLHEGLLKAAAGQLPGREDWDLRVAMCRHMYEDAEIANQWRERIPELRTSSAVLSKEPDPVLSLLMDELVHAGSDLEWASAVYEVVKPALLAAYREHMAATQQIVDQPTIRVLRGAILDLEAQLEWGEAFLAELRASAAAQDATADATAEAAAAQDAPPFADAIAAFLAAAGGVAGELSRPTDLPRRGRSRTTYAVPGRSVRDPRKMGETTWARTSVANPPDDPAGRELLMKMRVRQEEMTACDLVAAVLYGQKNMPWAFYRDLARHIWDEARHAMFGQAALEADGHEWMSRPQYTSDYDINADKIPAVQYAWLSIGIEEGAMISLGKKKEYEWCRDEAKHPLMAQFQDYDWADEIVHANLGRKWTPDLMGEELPFVREAAQKELRHFFAEVDKANKAFARGEASKA